MDIVFIFISIFTAVASIRFGIVSAPIFISSFILSTSSLIFSLVYYGIVTPDDYFGLPIPYEITSEGYSLAYLIHAPFLVLNIISLVVVTRLPPSSNSISSLRFYLPKIRSSYALVFAVAVGGLSFMHALSVDWKILWLNHSYLLTVRPETAGIDNALASTFHNSIGFVAAAMGFMFVYLASKRKRILAAIYLVFFIYLLAIKLSQFSRWAPLLMAVLLMSHALIYGISTKKSKIIIFFHLVLTFYFYQIAIAGRDSFTQGFSGLIDVISGSERGAFGENSILFFFLNVFGGFFVTAEAAGLDSQYPLTYKILSFSFLPGSMDGWRDVLPYTHFINQFTPYNATSEIYHFGAPYAFLFFFYYFLVQLYLVGLAQKGKLLGYFMILPCYLIMLVFMQFYPLRNSLKLLTVALIASVVLSLIKRKKTRSTLGLLIGVNSCRGFPVRMQDVSNTVDGVHDQSQHQ